MAKAALISTIKHKTRLFMKRGNITLFIVMTVFANVKGQSNCISPFDTNVGTFNGVDAYSNCKADYSSDTYNFGTGINTGMKWQCVEYVNRYYYKVYGLNLKSAGIYGNANNYYPNASSAGLKAYPNNGSMPPQVGDIICSNSGEYGHIAIVTAVSPTSVKTISQNFLNAVGGCYITLARSGNTISGFSGTYPIVGWLRYEGQGTGCDPVTITTQPTNQFATVGITATYSVLAGGSAPFTYQWYNNGAAITGATNNSYTTPVLTGSENGNTYYCHIANCSGNNSINSNTVTLSIQAGTGQGGQHIPYPVIFIHGLNSNDDTWANITLFLQQKYGWRYGGNMDFNLNYDGNNATALAAQNIHDFNKQIQAGDFYTINFDVDVLGKRGTGKNLSNQAAIVKQGMALKEAIKHVLDKIGKEKKVILVGHSMGGLAAREYLQNENNWIEPWLNHHVAKICTVGTPHGGSNADFGYIIDLLGSLTPFAKNLDVLSEATRDLRSNYIYSRNAGVYLFGGVEKQSDMLDQALTYFHNIDVNCNGNKGDIIIGLNSKFLPDLPYSCVIGTGDKLGGDGVVSEKSANLNNFRPTANADLFFTNKSSGLFSVWHTYLTDQLEQIVQGMDEPNYLKYAYNVDLDKWYKGNITIQSTTNYTATDIDNYALYLSSGGKLNIQVTGIPVNVFTVSVYSSSNLTSPIYSKNSNGSGAMNIDVPISKSGKYYVVLTGGPTPTSWMSPYNFNFRFTGSTPPQSSCFIELTASSGTFNAGTGTTDYFNNMDCSWLIQPQDASSITLRFSRFKTEVNNDIVSVYDGSDNTYPLLGKFSGNNIPPYIVSSGGSMFVEFVTNGSVTSTGWDASYEAEIGDITPIRIPEKLNGYRYWFDENLNNGATINKNESSAMDINELIPSTSLQKGFHTFSLMTKQTDGRWSAPFSELFFYYKNAEPAIYEYWFDSLFENKKTIQISDTNNLVLNNKMLNASGLPNGFHQLNIRFKPAGGFWSPIDNEIFFKNGNAIIPEKHLAQFEYWFDSSYENAKLVTTADTSNLDFKNQLLDASNLIDGFHQVNYRFRSNDSLWSAVENTLIYKHQKFTINAFDYWFDDGVTNKKKVQFQPTETLIINNQLIDASGLSNGFHQFNISFLSEGTNVSSAIQTEMIFKRGNDTKAAMDIKKIRYWFNRDFTIVKEIVVSGKGGILANLIDCNDLPAGKNIISYQMMDNGNIWSSTLIDTFMNINTPLIVRGKVFLQGAYNATNHNMNNSLNATGLLSKYALNQPYTIKSFNYNGTEQVSPEFFSTHSDVVDWIMVELRDSALPSKIVAKKAALLKQDGTIIETDGSTTGVKFLGVSPGHYFIAIHHRNHLGIRSLSTIDFSGGTGDYDFTSAANKTYQNQTYTSTISINGVWVMRGGDANSNGIVKFNGPANDQSQILNIKLLGSLSNILNSIYSPEDINMDGNIRWNGPQNEQNILLNTILQGSLTSIFIEQL